MKYRRTDRRVTWEEPNLVGAIIQGDDHIQLGRITAVGKEHYLFTYVIDGGEPEYCSSKISDTYYFAEPVEEEPLIKKIPWNEQVEEYEWTGKCKECEASERASGVNPLLKGDSLKPDYIRQIELYQTPASQDPMELTVAQEETVKALKRQMGRKIVQIATTYIPKPEEGEYDYGIHITALCSDGSGWVLDPRNTVGWFQLPPIPQPEEKDNE